MARGPCSPMLNAIHSLLDTPMISQQPKHLFLPESHESAALVLTHLVALQVEHQQPHVKSVTMDSSAKMAQVCQIHLTPYVPAALDVMKMWLVTELRSKHA